MGMGQADFGKAHGENFQPYDQAMKKISKCVARLADGMDDFALLTIPVGYWAGRSLFGERAGWFTAILFALNSYLTTYAQETRMYSMLAFFTLVAAACFLHGFVFRRRGYLPVLSVAMALMLNRGFQEEGEAAGKWRRALLTSTQLSTYFVGYAEVSAIGRARPDGVPLLDWHDRMLAHGSPSPRHLRGLLIGR